MSHLKALCCALIATGIAALSVTQSLAQQGQLQCGSEPVTARGEPAGFEWIAKTKSHANWRAKVRGMPGLGNPYADWKRAKDAQDICETGDNGTVCTFKGIPCRTAGP